MHTQINLARIWTNYQTLAIRTAKELPTLEDDLNHVALGVASEIGELCEVYALHCFKQPLPDKYKTARQGMLMECGDVLWYLALLSNVLENYCGFPYPGIDNPDDMLVRLFAEQQNSTSAMLKNLGRTSYQVDATFGGLVDHKALVHTMHIASGAIANLVSEVKCIKVYESDVASLVLWRLWAEAVFAINHVIAHGLGGQVNIVMQDNIDKLKRRYPEKYSNEHAAKRLDMAEAGVTAEEKAALFEVLTPTSANPQASSIPAEEQWPHSNC